MRGERGLRWSAQLSALVFQLKSRSRSLRAIRSFEENIRESRAFGMTAHSVLFPLPANAILGVFQNHASLAKLLPNRVSFGKVAGFLGGVAGRDKLFHF